MIFKKIIKINHERWKIEESFRIIKSEFRGRPIYLQREDRIKAHFLTCFISLLIYRILEKRLDYQYSCEEILATIKNMNFFKKGDWLIPSYTRTELTDKLHNISGFRTDYEIYSNQNVKKLIKTSKKKNIVQN